MTPGQLEFLISIAEKIPRLFNAISEGNVRAEFILGSRMLKGRQVKLVLVAEVVDPGDNPLTTHSQPMPEITEVEVKALRNCDTGGGDTGRQFRPPFTAFNSIRPVTRAR